MVAIMPGEIKYNRLVTGARCRQQYADENLQLVRTNLYIYRKYTHIVFILLIGNV